MRRTILVSTAALLAASVGLAGYLATRPATWRVDGTVSVAAPYPMVVAQLSDLRRWPAWSPLAGAGAAGPFEHLFGGPAGGVGQSGYWREPRAGNELRVTLVEASATRVGAEVEGQRPHPWLRDLEFVAEAAGETTRLTQVVAGENDLRRRLRALFSNPDEDEARELRQGLAQLKVVAEAEAKVARFRLMRSVRVVAPAALVRALLTDPRRFADYSPWEPADGEVQRTFGGAAQGVGASYYWSQTGVPGRGRATVTVAEADRVEVELVIERPRPLASDLEVRLAPDGDATQVTWIAMGEQRGEDGQAAAAGAVDVPSERDLALGLARLKVLAEAEARAPASR